MPLSKLEKKIKDSYSDSNFLISIIRKIDLEASLNRMIDLIETALFDNNTSKVKAISGVILNEINTKIGKIKDLDEKKKIEYLLADIFQEYIENIAYQENGKNILIQINENLKSTCDLLGYDYNAFSKIFNIDKHIILTPQRKNLNQLHYEWIGKSIEIDEIAKDIYDKKWIYSVKEFKRLFKPVTGNLQIRCNREKKKELLLLFHILKEKGLIRPIGKGNSGHFAPFVKYAIDNEEKYLFEKAANKFHDSIKRKESEYSAIKRKVEGIVMQNVSKSNRQ